MATETDGVGGPAPRTTDTTFNAAGEETSETDPDGNETTTTYDAAGLVTADTDGRNVETTDQYNTAGLVTVETADANTATPEVTRDYYDNAGDLTATVDPLGDKTVETYDADSDVTSTTDGDHNTTLDTYDAEGDVLTEQEKNALGVVVSTESALYNGDGDVTSSTDADHNVTTDSYDAANDQTAEVDDGGVGGSDANIYDKDGNLVWSKDADGNVTVNTYDDDMLVESKTTAEDGHVISDVTDTYNLFGEVTSTKDGDGNVTTDTYDGDDNVLTAETVNAHDQVVSFDAYTYDGDGDVTSTTDADHNVTTEIYNADDEVVGEETTDALGREVSAAAEQYDADGNVTQSVDGDGNVTFNSYDDNRLVESLTVSATGRTVSNFYYSYDANGNVLTTTDGDGNTTINTYDANGNVLTTQLRDAHGNLISSQENVYDGNGNLLESVDGDGNRTSYTYDGTGNVLTTEVTNAQGRLVTATTNTYDEDGNLITTTDAAGDVTFNQYEDGNLVATTVGYGTSAAATTTYTYDDDGNQTSETDPDGNTTYYTYDADGNVLTTTTPLGTTTNTYDDDGNLLTTVDPDGRSIVNFYDGNLLVRTIWYNANGSINNEFTYTYDADGNMLTATDNAGTVSMTYNGNELVSRTDPFGETLTYGYDAAGNIIVEADSLGGLTTMTYDGNQIVSQAYQDSTTHLVSYFAYDGDGNQVLVSRYSYISGAPQLAATTQTSYDGGEVTSIVSVDASGNVLQSDYYTYDAAGRLASETDNGVTTAFGYDATGQLTSDGGTDNSYDANGNRTIAGYVTGTDNELLSDGTWNYTYDAMGNTISKVNIATGETWTYAYDLNNRLISATDETAGGALIQQVTFVYDALGDRISETATINGAATTTNYAYDASGNAWADLDGNNGNALETRRLFLQGADQVFARLGEGGVAWYLADYQGTIQDLIGDAGNVLDQRTYDAFGNIISETNPAAGDGYGFQGMWFEAMIGTYRADWRLYNPVTGEWMSQDPSGLGPDSNRYRFDGNGPTDGTDPTGLWEWPLSPNAQWDFGWAYAKATANETVRVAEATPGEVAMDASYVWQHPDTAVLEGAHAGNGGGAIMVNQATFGLVAGNIAHKAEGELGPTTTGICKVCGATVAVCGAAAAAPASVGGAGTVLTGAGVGAGYGTASQAAQIIDGNRQSLDVGGICTSAQAGAAVPYVASAIGPTMTKELVAGATAYAGAQGVKDLSENRPAEGLVNLATAGTAVYGQGRILSALAAEEEAPASAVRLPQDINVNPTAPPVRPLTRPIGQSPTQNAAMQADRAAAESAGATDFRVNQQQVNAAGQRVGTNRPDLQYTDANGRRVYVEYDTTSSTRGPGHKTRILANDPNGNVILRTVD